MSRRKLLLADDSLTIQKVVNLTFADEGIEVETVGDGDTAMERIYADRPTIVLADVNMPGLTGYQICERLRSEDATREMPVILLVGSFEPFDEAEAARVGANAYLTKPFQSIRQLVAQVSELMETAPVQEHEPVQETEHIHEAEPAQETEPVPQTEPEEVQAVESETASFPEIVEQVEESSAESEPAAVQPQHFDDLGYPSPPPTQSIAEDIDSLYDRSLSHEGPDDLSEIGIDDDMIETSYAAGSSDQDTVEFERENFENVGETYSDHKPEEETYEASVVAEEPSPELTETHETNEDAQKTEEYSGMDWAATAQTWQTTDADTDEGFRPLPAEAPVDQTAPSETAMPDAPVGAETIRMDSRFDTTGSANFQFDEVDLLDLEASQNGAVEITTPINAIEQGSSKQVVSLSPELIEMIAQRVLEKMSEKY